MNEQPSQDFDFNPFHDHVIASGSDDTSIKVRVDLPSLVLS